MIYGYAVLKEVSYTNGKPAWREDAWEKDTVVDKVRLFASEKERNNIRKRFLFKKSRFYIIDKKYNILERYRYNVVPFKTKGSQGKLIIGTKL